jgi:hypothetical protein
MHREASRKLDAHLSAERELTGAATGSTGSRRGPLRHSPPNRPA